MNRNRRLDAPTNSELRALRDVHGLTRPRIAKMALVSLGAVDRWLLPPSNSGYRRMPEIRLMYLKTQLVPKKVSKKG